MWVTSYSLIAIMQSGIVAALSMSLVIVLLGPFWGRGRDSERDSTNRPLSFIVFSASVRLTLLQRSFFRLNAGAVVHSYGLAALAHRVRVDGVVVVTHVGVRVDGARIADIVELAIMISTVSPECRGLAGASADRP